MSAMGTYAIGEEFVVYALTCAVACASGVGLAPGQTRVLALGVGTRNIGAALARLFAVTGTGR